MTADTARFDRILAVSLMLFLTSCMATPEIRLNAGGMEMELSQKAPISLRASISPSGKYLLTGGYREGVVKLWDISAGAQVGRIQVKPDTHVGIEMPIPVAFTSDGKYVLTGGKMSRFGIYQL
jgi:WD40 repeat protein